MTWKCQSETITKVSDRVRTSNSLPPSVFNNIQGEQIEANLQRDQISIWHSIVEDYGYDRAISGIVSELALCWNDKY
jgi:hypothetical protein